MFDSPQAVGLWAAVGSVLFEWAAASFRAAAVRRSAYLASLIFTSFSAVVLLNLDASIGGLLLLVIAAYRVINAMRVLAGRMHPVRTYNVTRRSSLVLGGLQLVTIVIWWLDRDGGLTLQGWLYYILSVALIFNLMLLLSARRNLKKSALRTTDRYISDETMPSLSICVPARNETEDLTQCLKSILASDYPKLEVLVLDDCSHDNTPEIIKSFARAGVRFIKGDPPKKGWLARNQACQTLAEAATGDVLLFCGVDIRFEPKSLRSLIGVMLKRKKAMLSLLPITKDDNHQSQIQPLKFWWELALPRRWVERPPALSAAWLIRKDYLMGLGGFMAVDNSVIPEAYFARELARADAYGFMRAGGKLDLTSERPAREQRALAVRLRYPAVRKRPENVALLTLAGLSFLIAPLAVFLATFFVPLGPASWLAAASTAVLLVIHAWILRAQGIKQLALLLATFPASVVLDIYLLHASMWSYEFGTVEWKERNICLPVMRAIPHLPKI